MTNEKEIENIKKAIVKIATYVAYLEGRSEDDARTFVRRRNDVFDDMVKSIIEK